MKVTNAIMQGVADIFTASKARRDAEYADFLSFYRNLVENVSADVAKAIGKVNDFMVEGSKDRSQAPIYLTATCYLEWKQAIADGQWFTKSSIEQVKTFMLMALAKSAEANKLTTEERKALMALLDQ